ncbi:hypothetical protein llap_7654 [Limosa lapponica baueri]|uniref:Uncharacterized protein n=1 Tax=Limosa lapponica baueri TaxID=1758121 RepID=A0A2I0U7P0_LIMLA|nr:hypothetical protein llap_7654 [Limosa lapponica baueri]
MQLIRESTTHKLQPSVIARPEALESYLAQQTELSPSKTFKFMEKHMEQLKEGHTELLKEMLVQLWRKEEIPRFVESFIFKTKIANIEMKLANGKRRCCCCCCCCCMERDPWQAGFREAPLGR